MHLLHHLVHLYGYPVITVAIALECAGMLIPAETLFFGTAVYASTTGRLNIFLVVAAACAGAILGSLIGFWLGRLLGSRVIGRYGPRIGLNPRRLALVRYLFCRHGGKVVFFGRFVSVLRSFTPILAGASLMPSRNFLLWAVAGGIAWPVGHGLLASAFGHAARKLSTPATAVLGLVGAAAVIAGLYLIKRNEARLTETALRWEQHERV